MIDNRIHIVDEVRQADEMVKTFIKNEFLKITSNPYLEEIIRAQIHPLIVDERYPIVWDKIKKIIS